jgi:radical SAM superfamily enzyme YgiQ (UPF0313 family)
MVYEGPIYRPPSEADSLLVQATVGCPWNKCTFCLVYKKGLPYRARTPEEIEADLTEAAADFGPRVRTLFFPAGNTIAMKPDDLARVCRFAHAKLPNLERITVYGSSRYLVRLAPADLKNLAEAGLSRIHVGFESGHDEVLRRVKKGTTAAEQVRAGLMVREAGIELTWYVLLGLGGPELSDDHARASAAAINRAAPPIIRLRTLVPKINTLLLHQIRRGRFSLCSPHDILNEILILLENIALETEVFSDHYTNYLNVAGRLPADRERLLAQVRDALARPESSFRGYFVGRE